MFPNVNEMTDEICILGQPTKPGVDIKVNNSGTWVTCLFDNGADSGIHTQELAHAVDLEKLENKMLTLQTINGTVKKSFEISKIKLANNDIERKKSTIHSVHQGDFSLVASIKVKFLASVTKNGVLSF